MTFPNEPLPIQTELMVDGAWVDISPDVYARDPITITRGRSAEAADVDPGTCSLTLNNRAGKYTVRHPMSPYYGKIGRNTPIRVSVHAGSPSLDVTLATNAAALTPTVTEQVLGLDVRIDASLDDWAPLHTSTLAGQAATGHIGWALTVWQQRLVLYWSRDGGVTFEFPQSTALLALPPSGRLSLRATLLLDDGHLNHTITYYTGPSVSGPWTQLGDPIVTAGTVSPFTVTAPFIVGSVTAFGFATAAAHIHAAEISYGASVVAAPDFAAQPVGATSFVDSAGLTWTLSSGAALSNKRVRFTGEVPSWPRMRDTSGQDRYVQLQAAGILRRLSQGQAPLQSTLRRRIPTEPTLLAYWPMEDGPTATQASSPIAGVRPLRTNALTFGSASTLAGSDALPVLASNAGAVLTQISGSVPAPPAGATSWKVEFVYRIDQPDTTVWTVMRLLSTGAARDWYFQMSKTVGRILAHDVDGNEVLRHDTDLTTFAPFGDWYRVQIRAVQSGANVAWTILWVHIDGTSGQTAGTFPGTVGRVTGIASPPDGYAPALDGMALGHISVMTNPLSVVYNFADHGFNNELASARLARLAQEESLPLAVLSGADDPSTALGPQTPETVLALLDEAADADQGILYESRDSVGLTYRSRATLYNQAPTVIAYEDLAPGLATPDDDQLLQNDVTITRAGGSSGRVTQEEGALSVLPPPDGVGPYPTSATLNLASDGQAAAAAGWRVRLGTVDEPRYPTVPVNLARTPELIDRMASLDTGARLQVASLPDDFPPGPIDALVQGYTEALSQFQWDWTGNCTPASPYTVAVVPEAVETIVETFDSADAVLPHTDGGNAPWLRVTGIFDSWVLGSGHIGDEQTSDAIFTMPDGAVSVSFEYLVSSEAAGPTWTGDQFQVFIDDVLVLTDQGAKAVQTVSFPVQPGSAVIFRYSKDDSTAAGLDAVYINNLTVTLAPAIETPRADTGGSELAAAVDEDDTNLPVTTTGVWRWITTDEPEFADDFPFEIQVGGEVMTVTAIAAGTTQQFTVTRAVNGIRKAHPAGEDVRLAVPSYVAL